MDPDYKKFGRGPREPTGAVDLISYYRLLPYCDFFRKRLLALSVSDTHYLHNVVGDTEIRKGVGMQWGQLIQYASLSKDTNTSIQPFDLDILTEAFQLRETTLVDFPFSEEGTPPIAGIPKSDSKDKEKMHKKHKDKGKDKDKERKKNKHRHKDRSKDKDKDKKKEKGSHREAGNDQTRRPHEGVDRRILYKGKDGGDDNANDIQMHKKSKPKSLKTDETGAIKRAARGMLDLLILSSDVTVGNFWVICLLLSNYLRFQF